MVICFGMALWNGSFSSGTALVLGYLGFNSVTKACMQCLGSEQITRGRVDARIAFASRPRTAAQTELRSRLNVSIIFTLRVCIITYR